MLTGSREAYELHAGQVRELVEDCPAHLAQVPASHCCAEIPLGPSYGNPRRRPYAELHAQYCR